jgi:phospholipase/carboxylesterase
MHDYQITETGSSLGNASYALILLHGRGATAGDILTLAPHFTDESWYIAAPQATNQSWYPFTFMSPVSQNEPWLSSAIDIVHQLLQTVLRILPSEKIYIMGFSQGACLTTEVTARFARKYGGIVAFTGGLIGDKVNHENYKGQFNGTKIYLSNSDSDPHVPLERTRETGFLFNRMGAHAEIDIYPNRPHTVSQQEINKAKAFVFG